MPNTLKSEGKIKRTFLAYIGLSILTLIVGMSLIFIKIGLRYANSIDLLAYRFAVAFLSIVVLRIVGVIRMPIFQFKKRGKLWLLALFYPVSFFFFQAYGMMHTTASEAGIVLSLAPIITLVAAGIFLKEKTAWWQKIGVVLSVAGIVYIILQKSSFSLSGGSIKGIFLLMLALSSVVAYFILGKKIIRQFTPAEMTVWMVTVAFVVFGSISLSLHGFNGSLATLIEPIRNTDFWLAILYLGILSSVLTSFLSNFALSAISASQIAVFNNLGPIISIIGGLVFLGEMLYSYHIVGGVLVLTGVVISLFPKSKV